MGFSADGASLLVENSCYNLQTGETRKLVELSNFSQVIGLRSDGAMLYEIPEGEPLNGWNLATGQRVFSLPKQPSPISNVAVTPDGRIAVTADFEHFIKVWDLTKATLENKTERPVKEFACVEGQVIAWFEGGEYQVFNLPGGEPSSPAEAQTALNRWTARSKTGASTLSEPYLSVWNHINTSNRAGTRLRIVDFHAPFALAMADIDQRIKGDESKLRTVFVYDLRDGKEAARLEDGAEVISGISISPNGDYILAAHFREVSLWETKSFRKIAVFTGEEQMARGEFAHEPQTGRLVVAAQERMGRFHLLVLERLDG